MDQYSTSAEERDTVCCFLVFHEIEEHPSRTNHPIRDLRVKRHLVQSESHQSDSCRSQSLHNKTLCPIFPFRGVVNGAATVYFSYIGYDSASTLAEEIKDPFKSLPIGIMGSILITTILYCLMALSLGMMAPYNKLSNKATFSIAFAKIGWILGIVASLLVVMLGQARYLCVIARARLVLSWFNYSSGVCTASIALFTELGIIIELVNIRTLLVFYLVANALIYRRYVITSHTPPIHTLLFQFLFSLGALGFSLSWKFNQQQWGLPLFGGLMITITAFYHHKVPHHTHADDADWCVPFMPWPPALSIFLNVFLITTLKLLSFQRFAMWACFITLFYVLYGVHSTYQAEEETEIGSNQLNSSSSNLQTKVEVQVL
uniref:Cationic amino acid transporter C-terminal domain-containing protein n=1 Tax=Glycine max TaxID=3847 RepID=K7LMX4_SOYBN